MADLGFLPAVTRILTGTPAGGQRLLFSATLDRGVDTLVKRFLSRPLVHSVDSETSPVATLTHHVFLVGDATQKRQIVRELAGGAGRRLLFLRTKHQARKLARDLTADGIPAVELHGNLSQNARERGLKAFADGEVTVMVATDIAARGIHVDDVDLVVHVDPPAEHKAYLHRSGRTARAGNDGDVITLVLPEQRRDFQALARAAKISATPASVRAGDGTVRALAGEPAPLVAPAQAPDAAARKGQPDQSSTGRSGGGRRSSGGRAADRRPAQTASARQGSGGARHGRGTVATGSQSVVQLSRQGNSRRHSGGRGRARTSA